MKDKIQQIVLTTSNKNTKNHTRLRSYFVASIITALGITTIWIYNYERFSGQERYAITTTKLLSYASKNYVIKRDVINLTLLGKEATKSEEIDRLVFYDFENKILGVVGTSLAGPHYTQPIVEDGILAGYITVSFNQKAFNNLPVGLIVVTTAFVILIVTLILFLSTIPKNPTPNSIPIIAVPDKKDCQAYSLFINVHNRLALSEEINDSAIDDALTMAAEVCALLPGSAFKLSDHGILVLFDREGAIAYEGIKATWLLQQLLIELETPALYRFFLSTCVSKGKPSELSVVATGVFSPQETNLAFRIASLTKENTISISEDLFNSLSEEQKDSCEIFEHPVLEDIAEGRNLYTLTRSEDEKDITKRQVDMILGFKEV